MVLWMLILSGDVDPEHGPLIAVRIQIDRTLRRAYESVARPLPMPVSGVALIDTGAVQSGIDEAVALSLGLNPVGVSELLTPTGDRTKVGVFWGEVDFVGTDLQPLRQQFLGMKLGYMAGEERVVALLGRDFLSDARLDYDGPSARYTVRFASGAVEQRTAPREVVWTLLPET
jgi:hypothetical protein